MSGRKAATMAAEEFSKSIQAPSSTHPGTMYPVRVKRSLLYGKVYTHMYTGIRQITITIYEDGHGYRSGYGREHGYAYGYGYEYG